ncbi:hypothetical protein ACLKA7_009991 [Drosophila subpalustris]
MLKVRPTRNENTVAMAARHFQPPNSQRVGRVPHDTEGILPPNTFVGYSNLAPCSAWFNFLAKLTALLTLLQLPQQLSN